MRPLDISILPYKSHLSSGQPDTSADLKPGTRDQVVDHGRHLRQIGNHGVGNALAEYVQPVRFVCKLPSYHILYVLGKKLRMGNIPRVESMKNRV